MCVESTAIKSIFVRYKILSVPKGHHVTLFWDYSGEELSGKRANINSKYTSTLFTGRNLHCKFSASFIGFSPTNLYFHFLIIFIMQLAVVFTSLKNN